MTPTHTLRMGAGEGAGAGRGPLTHTGTPGCTPQIVACLQVLSIFRETRVSLLDRTPGSVGGGGWELGSWTWRRRRRRLGVWTLKREGGGCGGQSCDPRHPRLKQRVGAGTSPVLPPITGGAAFRQAGPRPRPPHPLGPGHPPGWWPESPWLAPPVWGGLRQFSPH